MSTTVTAPKVATFERLMSLDIVRGITIWFMIIVNNSGRAAYAPLHHAQWNGWTPTDLVFPSFLFLVGTSIEFALGRRMEQGAARLPLAIGALRRAAILFVLGLVVNGFPHFHPGTQRIYGVLQRIALCYLIASLVYLWRRDVRTEVTIIVLAIVGYWVLMRFVPVPGAGLPGRDIPLLDPDQNLVAWLDRHLLPGRLYEGVRDPEGLLSCLPALGTTFLGMLTGKWLRSGRTRTHICIGLLAGAVLLITAGQLWNLSFPINKKLWTSSYVLFAAGCTLLLFAACYWLADVKRWQGGWTVPWRVFGTNAIFAYMLSELLPEGLGSIHLASGASVLTWIDAHSFHHISPPPVAALAFSLAITLVCWLATYLLWKKKIFLKI